MSNRHAVSDINKMKEDLARLQKDYCELLLKSTDQSATTGGAPEKHKVFGIDYSQGNDEKVCFFTGLTNWEILSKLFEFVKPHLVGHQSLTPFQQLMLTMM